MYLFSRRDGVIPVPVQVGPVLPLKLRTRVLGPRVFGGDFTTPRRNQLRLKRLCLPFGGWKFGYAVSVDQMHINKLPAARLAAMCSQHVLPSLQRSRLLVVQRNDLVFDGKAFKCRHLLSIDIDFHVFIVVDQQSRFGWDRLQSERLPEPDVIRRPGCADSRPRRIPCPEAAVCFLPSGVIEFGLPPAICRFANGVSPGVDNLIAKRLVIRG